MLQNPVLVAICLFGSMLVFWYGRAMQHENEGTLTDPWWFYLPIQGIGAVASLFFATLFVKWAWSL